MNIPPIFPDEHVLGWRGRICMFNHYPNLFVTIQELRSWVGVIYGETENTKGLPQLSMLAKASSRSVDDLITKHSCIPFLRAFQSDGCDVAGEVLMSSTIINSYGLRTGKAGAWYCTGCNAEARRLYGIAYWRREHQISGVNWCKIHDQKLTGVSHQAAFEQPPESTKYSSFIIYPLGPSLTSRLPSVIQRYLALTAYILRPTSSRFDHGFVATYLKARGRASKCRSLTRMYVDSEQVPGYWSESFFLGTEVRVKDINEGLARTVRNSAHPADSFYYVLALALLCESEAECIEVLENACLSAANITDELFTCRGCSSRVVVGQTDITKWLSRACSSAQLCIECWAPALEFIQGASISKLGLLHQKSEDEIQLLIRHVLKRFVF